MTGFESSQAKKRILGNNVPYSTITCEIRTRPLRKSHLSLSHCLNPKAYISKSYSEQEKETIYICHNREGRKGANLGDISMLLGDNMKYRNTTK